MSDKLISEGNPVIVTADEYEQLKAAHKLRDGRWCLCEQNGEWVWARVRIAGQRHVESLGADSPKP